MLTKEDITFGGQSHEPFSFCLTFHMNAVLVLCVLGALYVRCRRYTINMHSMRLQCTCNTYNVSSTSIFT